MAEKTDNLLQIIVEEYVESCQPVGSPLVVEKYWPEVSSATVRNYMAELEDQGLIFQPHTSAGRIPTARGYQRYIELFVDMKSDQSKHAKKISGQAGAAGAASDATKTLAKQLAEVANNAVIVAFSPRDLYYTGLSNLFRQPEFTHSVMLYSMSTIIDHLDEVIGRIYDSIDQTIVLVGPDNPFGELSAAVATKYTVGNQPRILAVLGPNRMRYQENVSLVNYTKQLLQSII